MNKENKYTYAIGRRKESVATVRIYTGKGENLANDKPLDVYFPSKINRSIISKPLITTENLDSVYFTAKLTGGGKSGQRDALMLAIARALVIIDPANKTLLKAEGLMSRDPRMVERKHTGHRKARKSEQYSKR